MGIAALVTAQQPAVSVNPAGQTPPSAAVQLDPAKNRLDALLLQWEQKMKAVTALQADVVRTDTDSVLKQSKTWRGQAKMLRPDQASLYLQLADNPNIFEQYVFTGTFLYEYRPQTKIVRVHEVAARPGQVVEDNFLNFLFGMKAEDAKRRYDLTLIKEDQHYTYIRVVPRQPADAADFTVARLALWNTTFLPRELQFELPNKDVTKWDIPRVDPTARLSRADFTPPQYQGWRMERVPRQQPGGAAPVQPAAPQPSKVRPAGG
jgi:TIGR03009 family protein